MTLEHPYSAPTLTVTLDNPMLSNARRADDDISLHRSRNGSVYSYVNRGYQYTLEFDVPVDTRVNHDAVLNLLRTAAQTEIKVTDHNAQVWKVRNVLDVSDFEEVGQPQGTCTEITMVQLRFRGLKI